MCNYDRDKDEMMINKRIEKKGRAGNDNKIWMTKKTKMKRSRTRAH